jgi:putative addiction module antidote
MLKLKITTIGSSAGVILPKEVLARLKIEKGDQVFMVETKDGYLLTPYDPSLDEQLELGRDFMKEYRDTFRALAK